MVLPDGHFTTSQLPPGTYRVIVFEHDPGLEYSNEDEMRKYDAQVVTVLPGQKAKIQVGLSAE